MRQTQFKWISSCATGVVAMAFYLVSGLPNSNNTFDRTDTAIANPDALGSGLFKHDLYFGDDRDTLNSLATEDLQLLAYYGG
ncbi:hypothetical protein ACFQRK_00080 [Parapedobacter sp. GCM10030251]|uniref:hypothetical protein n=1 Tax=Parapedobacter sp. GCM10030251 TaxID=3273419 RepID=UPI003617935D